ncbi:Type IV secretory pathway, VirB4 components (plasmid) [Tsukamurella tyrosinosolvens]|uniref:AAA-like domain-containing protein n=1 Tax=Tsukamurella tyrosinosolvens TaxID=57704 RepID=A0A1H4VT20_TSUTY|nr:ATP-binding protein [Tsukamurella tyrosinosolvens]KXO90613.1 AAA family ATPase [Tsukamurella tyrosinosolvens]SEC84217.1 AAA-like domain-containing protein [Tsukamurella tyrosinosolvens]VEH90309.1 Type IV secretory pathway, VirB4 components [Tsukamurella tyrosinosolvens]
MGTHVPPLSWRKGNIIAAEDGTVWCNYFLTGININAYRAEQAGAAQTSHEMLYTALSDLPSDDIMFTGFRARTDPMEIMDRITASIPDWDPEHHKFLGQLLNEFFQRMQTGEFVEFDRIYWVAVAHNKGAGAKDRLVSSVVDVDPHEGLDLTNLGDFEKACFTSIPSEFRPVRTTPNAVDWAFDRATTRGLTVPTKPKLVPGSAKPSEKSYPEVAFDEAAESTALYSKFLEDVREGRGYVKSLHKVDKRRAFFKRFRTLSNGKIMAISQPGKRTAEMPDGPVSYQSCMAIARYPSDWSDQVSSFTYIVDQAIGVDADFTLRLRFDQSLVDTGTFSSTDKNLVSEGMANAADEFEAFSYVERRDELRDFHAAVKADSSRRGMQVTAIFAFGHKNLDHLQSRLSALTQRFRSNGFVPILPVGGQKELWTMMMPGSSRTGLGDDLLQTTTAHWFSGAIPLRRSFAGDQTGVPIAINKENANGQIILVNLINATDRGNASIAFTGAQGGGKSHAMKLILMWIVALNRYASIIDHSKHGEWAVYCRPLARTQVVNAASGETSTGDRRVMDPLKCLPSPAAETVMLAHYLPLFELDTKSVEASYFAQILRPAFREPRGITSTRRLMEYLRNSGDAAAQTLLLHFDHWAALHFTAAFIDPVPKDDNDKGLPPFDDLNDLARRMEIGDNPYATVFRTQDLPVYRGDKENGGSDINKWAAAAYGSIARITAYRFEVIRSTCVFLADEISFLKGNEDVLELLIRNFDRTGRKDRNLVVAGSQHAEDFDHNYTMIERIGALRQRTKQNAIAALRHVGLPILDAIVDVMVTKTSPPDPDNDNLVRAGRHGEGWWNDGNNNIVRVQYLPILSSKLARFSDTTASNMLRESDLRSAPEREAA